MSVVCYCDDCEEGARRIEALPNARSVRGLDGGNAYVLYRKDRVVCSKGARLLQGYKIIEQSATKRVVETCCNSAMFLDFEKGHWLSVYLARFAGDVPPLQMRGQTKSKPENNDVTGDLPGYPGYPLKFMAKLAAARLSMLLRR